MKEGAPRLFRSWSRPTKKADNACITPIIIISDLTAACEKPLAARVYPISLGAR